MISWSHYFLPTLRQDPKDSDAISHKLMVRAGLIRRLGSGAYSYLPFGLRALQKAAAIVREEMNRAGAQELLMPVLQPAELWKATGRDKVLGEILIQFKDRTGKAMVLGPTHEEVVTELLKEIQSYKQLPVTVYQIQTKFRDEPRPRFGVIRSKEFLMKDAYSFDVDAAGLTRSYETMYNAYQRIFARCGISVLACDADSGAMGGEVSHEFMAPAESGEDQIVRCVQCGYAANLEAARCQTTDHRPQTIDKPKPIETVKTPGQHTVEQVSTFLKVSPAALIKTLLYDVGPSHALGIPPQQSSEGGVTGHVAVLVRGDHEVNEAKLARVLRLAPPEGGARSGQSRASFDSAQDARPEPVEGRAESRDVVNSVHLKLSSPQTIERLTGAPVGFSGPVRLNGVRLLADHAVMGVVNGVTGANQPEAHLINVNPGRDFTPSAVADLRYVTKADACPTCQGRLEFVKTIEAGHVFKLGTKYSQALGAVVQDATKKVSPMIMGCYGIGINRILAAAIEQHHDDQGIIWPVALAPFHAVVSVLEASTPEFLKVGQELAEALTAAGLEVLLDDRDQSPGAKLKDADLIGVPIRVVIGKAWKSGRQVEVTARATKAQCLVTRGKLVETVTKQLDSLAPSQ